MVLVACESHTPSIEHILDQYPALGSGIYEELGRWESVLGEPKTLPQLDGDEPTFFYWPEHGVAVFTHPLYEGQLRHRAREERKVTSVILPLEESFHPAFLPIPEDAVARFEHLLPAA